MNYLGVDAASTGSGKILISNHREEAEHTIGFSNEQAQAISTIALTGTTNSAGEVYNIIINGVPYVKTYGNGIAAATIANQFSLLINASALVSSTVNAGTITIEAEKRGIPLVISVLWQLELLHKLDLQLLQLSPQQLQQGLHFP